ncbi:MAG: nucleoside 2-deoxyribosyltransferase [Candidatus Hodarchaeota archaeon]
MKIYLSGAIRGGREFQPVYQVILEFLKINGHEILTHHVAAKNVMNIEKSMSDRDIYIQDIKWLQECDAIIAEVSIPSLGVGYEIAYALGLSPPKPILALFDESRAPISAILSGNFSPTLRIHSYKDILQLKGLIGSFLNSLKKK